MAVNLLSRQWALILLGVCFAAYVLFQARFLVFGPTISIDSPPDGTVVTEPVVTITGSTRNAAWLSLNGRQIYTDSQGHWEEELLLSSGTSIMTASVKDRFGRTAEARVRITLNQ